MCAEMMKQVTIPVTVKCRLGVDDRDSWEHIVEFITTVSEEGGCEKFIIHARKAFLKGLNPKENRNIPPLKYDWVFELKKLFPHINFVINGGFDSVEKVEILDDGSGLEGCMSGRLAMNNPWEIARIDREIFGDLDFQTETRENIILDYADFAQKE
jgi:tRNA-dihydrouridine synthase A